MTNKIYIAIIVVLAVVTTFALSRSNTPTSAPLGAVPGSEFLNNAFLRGGATIGSACFATSTNGTLTVGMLERSSCIRIAATGAGQAAITLTLPASSTLPSLFPDVGGCREWWIDNSDTAAATTTTILKGTGIDLVGLDATGAGTGADLIDGQEYGQLKLCRQSDTDYVGFVQEWINAD